MLGDDPNVEAQRRQIRAQADDDIAEFIASLDADVGSGVPPPPQIKVTEVSSQPVEFDLVPFGGQDAGTTPAEVPPPPPPGDVLWACCQSDEDCSETTAEDCADAGGEWFPGQTCADDPCDGACCDEFGFCLQLSEFDCTGTFQGIGVPCDPNPCPTGECCGNNSFSYCGFTDGYYGTVTRTDYLFYDCYYHPPFDSYETYEMSVTGVHSYNSDCSESTHEYSGYFHHVNFLGTTCDCTLDADGVTWICDPVGCIDLYTIPSCGDSVPFEHETVGTETTCYDHYFKQQDNVNCGPGCLVDISADTYSLEELSDYRCPYPSGVSPFADPFFQNN